MPLPKPKSDEDKDAFLSRCMGDDVMNEEYPEEDQRFAVCQAQWDKKKESKAMKTDEKPAKIQSLNIQRELRYMPFENWEVREEGEQAPRLEGHASVFDQETEIFGLWREKVAPGAFKKTIKEHDIRALWNHNTDMVLGRNKAKTLELSEDTKGLRTVIHPPDTQVGRDAVTSIKRGDVTQMSIAFETIKQEWYIPEDKRELPLRTLREAKLYDVSPVTFPAFEGTSISARGEGVLPDGEIDPLEEARRLYRCAERGMDLTTEQRATLRAAVELYQPYLVEPEPEKEPVQEPVQEPVTDHHSSESEPEPELNHWTPQPDDHYSVEALRKQLEKTNPYTQ